MIIEKFLITLYYFVNRQNYQFYIAFYRIFLGSYQKINSIFMFKIGQSGNTDICKHIR